MTLAPPPLESAIQAALSCGDYVSARDLLLQAVQATPQRADLLAVLGQVQNALGAGDAALDAMNAALRLAPGSVALLINRAAVHLRMSRPADAERDARQALDGDPRAFGAHLNLGLALEAQNRFTEAGPFLAEALLLRPGHAIALAARARCAFRSPAAHCASRPLLRAAFDSAPDDPELGLMLAESLLNDAEIDAALEVFSQAVGSAPESAALASARLIAQHYAPGTGPDDLLRMAREWGTRFSAAAHGETGRAQCETGPLRIGWLSPRFADGPLVELVLPVMEAMEVLGTRMRLFASHVGAPSAASERFNRIGHGVRDVSGLDDEALVALLRGAELDLVVDLAGHAPGNRLQALSRRVAPLQVSWGDWFGTTGVPNMDVFVTDRFLSPAGVDAHFSEELLRLPVSRFCYRPSLPRPLPEPRTGGPLRFVSFNRVSKLNDDVLRTWARILAELPEARLQLRGGAFDDPAGRAHFLARAERCGLDPGRIEAHGYRPHAELVAAYQDADIALDPFPFSGCATSADALWMGLPAITLPGDTFVSRQTGALLHHLGLDECIAADRDDYVRIALALAADAPLRQRWRRELRRRMQERLDPLPLAHALLTAWRARLAPDNPGA